MTMMVHILIRLHGDEDWDAWGKNMEWYDRVDRIGELTVAGNWGTLASDAQEDRPHRRLDWGAEMHEMSLDEIRRLIGPRPDADRKHDGPDLAERGAESHAMLDSLSPDGRYAVVWMECY